MLAVCMLQLIASVPCFVAPWAASMIKHDKSYLTVYASSLAYRDLVRISNTFSTLFFDLVRHIDEEWNMLLSSIRSGTVREVQSRLQVSHILIAAEIREIRPPFLRAAHIWPKLKILKFICSGPFATVLTKARETCISPLLRYF